MQACFQMIQLRCRSWGTATVLELQSSWLEVGGADTVADLYHQAINLASPSGTKEEPARGSDGFQWDNSAAVEALIPPEDKAPRKP